MKVKASNRWRLSRYNSIYNNRTTLPLISIKAKAGAAGVGVEVVEVKVAKVEMQCLQLN